MTIRVAAEKVEKWAKKFGLSPSREVASTGSIYVQCSREDGESFTVRIADHGECYCTEDISVDPDGATLSQAVARMAEFAGVPVPSTIQAAKVRKARRDAILREMDELRYNPNPVARARFLELRKEVHGW